MKDGTNERSGAAFKVYTRTQPTMRLPVTFKAIRMTIQHTIAQVIDNMRMPK